MKQVKIVKGGCAVFPTHSVMRVESLDSPIKFVEEKANGYNYMPPNTKYEQFEGETTHFCPGCGKFFHQPEDFKEGVVLKNNYDFKEKEDHIIGTCAWCYKKLTKYVNR